MISIFLLRKIRKSSVGCYPMRGSMPGREGANSGKPLDLNQNEFFQDVTYSPFSFFVPTMFLGYCFFLWILEPAIGRRSDGRGLGPLWDMTFHFMRDAWYWKMGGVDAHETL